ncbi:MAG: enoyl-CoA hydratase/isomerase family protein [Gammaproteobacteria bacterium]
MTELIQIERDGAVAVLTMNQPERRNAFSVALRNTLMEALTDLNGDPACRAIVLTGAGAHFSGGGDIKSFNEQTVTEGRQRLKTGSSRLMPLMIAGAKPIVAAVEGYAYGAGLALAAACDYVVAAREASFSCAFIRMGFVPDLGLMWTLPRRIGLGRARRYMMTGKPFDAVQAEAMGLVDELVPQGGALAQARTVAAELAQAPTLAIELIKAGLADGLDDVLRHEIDYQSVLLQSEDHAEGKRAFFEKRPPKFTGR